MLHPTTTREVASGSRLKCFFYGLPGSGKTHLAGTFPAPLFLASENTADELRTWSGAPLTTLIFHSVQEFVEIIREVANTINARKPIGHYIPQTVILDNITELQNMVEHEVLEYRWRKSGEDKQEDGLKNFPGMSDRDWGSMYNVLMTARNTLHAIRDCHIIWIGHAKINEQSLNDKSRKKIEMKSIELRGSAKHFIPNNCQVLSYLEAKPMGQGRVAYYMYGQPHNGWNSRIHFPSGEPGFLRLGWTKETEHEVHPHYDDLAPYFGLPSRQECEKGVDFGD